MNLCDASDQSIAEKQILPSVEDDKICGNNVRLGASGLNSSIGFGGRVCLRGGGRELRQRTDCGHRQFHRADAIRGEIVDADAQGILACRVTEKKDVR
jgi:hypothetical protein